MVTDADEVLGCSRAQRSPAVATDLESILNTYFTVNTRAGVKTVNTYLPSRDIGYSRF